MDTIRRSKRCSFIPMTALGVAAALALVAAGELRTHKGILGAPRVGATVLAGKTGHSAPAAPARHTSTADPASGPTAGEIPSDAHLDASADVPAVRRLDPALRAAVLKAEETMRADGIPSWITSGWRTVAYQQRLYDEAVAQHGIAYARTHVATPDKTQHTKGEAVDIGPTAADDWLIRHGLEFGLCQTYTNEIWHFELTAADGQCPDPEANALG